MVYWLIRHRGSGQTLVRQGIHGKEVHEEGNDSEVLKEPGAGMCAFVRSVGDGVEPRGGGPREDCIRGRIWKEGEASRNVVLALKG
jgi:hypothetical protein